jgi:fibronectin-binding autotransporter adhesin
MKPRPILRRLACVTPLAITLSFPAKGAAVSKAASGTDLGDPSNWGGSAPTAGDTATWATGSLGSGLTLGTDATWRGITVTGGSTAIDISGAGRLNLGEGGFDLSASPVNLTLSNNVTLAANQSWKVADNRSLAVNGAISGTGGLQVGATIVTANHSGWLSTSSASPTTVATGVNLADLSSAGGVIAGNWITSPTNASGYQFTNDGTTATYQLQFYDGNSFTKVTKVQLSQSGGNIVASQVYAKYKTGNFVGQNFDSLTVDGSPPIGQDGYGVSSTTLAFGSAPAGIVLLGGNNDYTGATTIGSGTLRAASNSAFSPGSAVTLSNTPGATLDLAGFHNTIGSLAGAGTVTLGGATLTVGADNTSPAAFTGNLMGSTGSLVKSGTGTLTLGVGGSSDFANLIIRSGTTVLNGGTGIGTAPIVLNDSATGTSDSTLLLGNFTLSRQVTVANHGSGVTTLGANGSVANPEFSGRITLQRDVTLHGGTNTDRFTLTGGIIGTGNVTIAGTGRVMFLNGANSFNGNVTVNPGSTLQLHWGGAVSTVDYIPNGSKVIVNGSLKIAKGNNGSETIGGLEGNGLVLSHEGVPNVASNLVTDSANNHTFGGVLSNGGATGATLSLTKAGNGTQTLTAANTYTGATTVTGGKLVVNGSIATSTLTSVNAAAALGGSGTVGTTTIAGTHSPGNSPGVQTFTGDLTYQNGSNLVWELIGNTTAGRGTSFDGVNLTGSANLAFTGATTLNLDFALAGSTVDWSDTMWNNSITGINGWKVFDLASGSISGLVNLTIGTGTWNDGSGDSLASVRPNASFSLFQDGNDLYLNYSNVSAIPEPGSLLGLGVLLGAPTLLRRRRQG